MRLIQTYSSSFFTALAVFMAAACSAPPGTSHLDDNDGSGNASGDGDTGDGDGDGDGDTGDGDGDTGDGDGDGDTGDGDGDGDTGDGDVGDGDGDSTRTSVYLPPRIRRLTNAEYTGAVQALLGTTTDPGADFPPDSRQHGFTVNEAQRVAPLHAKKLDALASTLAAEAVADIQNFAPCADVEAEGEACARSFASDFASKAYRRPLEDGELESLITLYQAGEDGGSYQEGIELMVRGILQTPAFLYLTEIGADPAGELVQMTGYEIASALSFLLTNAPPDQQLLAAADAGELSTPEGRETQARRLLSGAQSGGRLVRIVREWLGIDRIFATGKDSNVFPAFEGLRDAMGQETADFVSEVVATEGGNVSSLLGADWTVASAELASMYGASGSGRVSVPDRRGLLNQGAFLSVYSHATETAPIFRGTAVMRRVACQDIELPPELMAEIIPPLPDPTKTTRERFSVHSTDVGCRGCHALIDPVGFSFEHLDGMGKFRTQENGINVDSATTVNLGSDFDGSYTNSNELAVAISDSPEVRECFARQLFRASSGEGTGAKPAEDQFLKAWETLPGADQGSLIEILVAMAKSDLFLSRGDL